MKNIFNITFIIFFTTFIFTQEVEEEVDPNIERVEKIQDLIDRVEQNRAELSSLDKARLDEFIKKVADRRFLLSKAKKQLADEEVRNQRLEDLFEANEILKWLIFEFKIFLRLILEFNSIPEDFISLRF